MLIDLYIRNYTLIEELRLSFDQGLTVITGETGAGKSILLGALALILGKRAEVDVLMDKNAKCIVEGHFKIMDYALESFFEAEDLEYADITILRREISPTGKSRAFINDSPVSLQALKELGDQLVDIHSQHRTLALNQADVQLAILDEFAGARQLSLEVKQLYNVWYKILQKKMALENEAKEAIKTYDYNTYLLTELETARIREGEVNELENELNLIRNQEIIRSSLWQANHNLSQTDPNALSLINQAIHSLGPASQFIPQLSDLLDRLESVHIEIKDIDSEVFSLIDTVENDPDRAATIEQRLDLLYNLLRKHQVSTDKDLISVVESLRADIQNIVAKEDELLQITTELERATHELKQAADKLSQTRTSHIPSLENVLLPLLKDLGLPDARFSIKLTNMDQPGQQGCEKAHFLFSANRGGELNDLSHIASGGERSRFMLAVKSCITSRNLLPTIIFDEIDTGISGEMATRVAQMLQQMGSRMQVVAITHLPQIASKGKKHLLVEKETEHEKTITTVRQLAEEERIIEIAKMISGAHHTEASRKTAMELLALASN